MRHNIYYTECGHYPDGQARQARPEDAGVEALQYAQSTPRSRDRSPVQRKPVLRRQSSSTGSLRDVAAAQCRTFFDSRCRRRFWSFATHLLSGTGSLQPVRACRLIAPSAWPKGWTQADRRRPRLRVKSQDGRTGANYRSMRSSCPGAFWHCDSSTQSRAGAGPEQKKTAQPDLKSSLADAAPSYDVLRPHLVHPEIPPRTGNGRAV